MKRWKKLRAWLISFVVALLTAVAVGKIVIPFAYQERGYHAVGGEWMLIIAVFLLTAWLVAKVVQTNWKGARKRADKYRG